MRSSPGKAAPARTAFVIWMGDGVRAPGAFVDHDASGSYDAPKVKGAAQAVGSSVKVRFDNRRTDVDEEIRATPEPEVSAAVVAELLRRHSMFQVAEVAEDLVSFRVAERELQAFVVRSQKLIQFRSNFVLPAGTDLLKSMIAANNCNNRFLWCRTYVMPRDDGRVLMAMDFHLTYWKALTTDHLHFCAAMLAKTLEDALPFFFDSTET